MMLLWIGIPSFLQAQLSPGALHLSHSQLEGVANCTKCHETGRQLSAKKCLACHTLLFKRISAGEGAHANEQFKQCENCHIEHQGRNFDLIHWNEGKQNFDHRLSGYPLEGAHKQLKCEQCHRSENIRDQTSLLRKNKNLNRTFLGLTQSCLTCHKDRHKGQLSTLCQTCHGFSEWKPAQNFNHTNTSFPLLGRHKTVPCSGCHPQKEDLGIQYKNLSFKGCADCHPDIHDGRLGGQCNRCHTPEGWRGNLSGSFNHDNTKYPLRGKHERVACTSCHTKGRSLKNVRYAYCRDCHDDYHRGQFASREQKGTCEECHTVKGFSPSLFTVAAHQKTTYPLDGAHLAVPCIACHKKSGTGMQFRLLSYDCLSCHPDPHGGEVDTYLDQFSPSTNKSGCQYCHNTKGWGTILFDHSKTGFVLLSAHQSVHCISCHTKNNRGVIRISGLNSRCNTCHTDIHNGQFADAENLVNTECQRCHQPDDWHKPVFDHNKDSAFPLKGRHAELLCRECHKTENKNGRIFVRYKPLAVTCLSCHGNKSQQDSSYMIK